MENRKQDKTSSQKRISSPGVTCGEGISIPTTPALRRYL